METPGQDVGLLTLTLATIMRMDLLCELQDTASGVTYTYRSCAFAGTFQLQLQASKESMPFYT